jgi:hypothetical protein
VARVRSLVARVQPAARSGGVADRGQGAASCGQSAVRVRPTRRGRLWQCKTDQQVVEGL